MGALATSVRIRQDLPTRLFEARARTDELFQIVRPEAMYDRPIAERPRIIFYLGHLEAFDWNLLAHRAFGLRPFHRSFDKLFAAEIDPADGGLPSDQPKDWPVWEEIERYNRRVREELDMGIEHALTHPSEGHPHLRDMLEAAIEYRLIQAEALAYLIHQLPCHRKFPGPVGPASHAECGKRRMIEIPAGRATLGLSRVTGDEFGWDNEFGVQEVNVPEFAMDWRNVTNGDFLRFLEAGGYENHALWAEEDWTWKEKARVRHPAFWKRDGNLWMFRTMFGETRLPLDWPVYVSHAEAAAYARWLDRRLPTEEQFHRAAFGTPEGRERSYPWGEDTPSEIRGNFDFYAWDPSPVGSHPAGASAFGVQDLLGNGWEWTRSVFAPLPGFAPYPFCPGHSTDLFDGKHYVLKGGSPRTAARLLRRSFRNCFPGHDPYVYATFRCVEE